MRVLVTGGAGYIGSHSCKALARAGHDVIAYDNLSTGHAAAVRWGPLERGDIRDRGRLEAALSRHQPDLVMHFAALAYVGESMVDPAAYYDVNVGGTLTLLDAMIACGVMKIVFSSSCATYGIPTTLPIREDSRQDPINPYGFTKLIGERALSDYEAAYGLRWMALRYFNAAGADADGELGEHHHPETHAVPLAILAALGAGAPFSLFGTDFATPDGSAVRDYVHVDDLARAHRLAAEHLARGGTSEAVNLGTGSGTSVHALLRAVEAATGRPVPYSVAPRRPGDPPALFADPGRARALLGWEPQVRTVAEMVASAARWLQRQGEERAA